MLAEILAGGAEIAAEAGVSIGGGHSIDDPEPKYGMAVSGIVHPDRVLTAAGAQAGDELYLTQAARRRADHDRGQARHRRGGLDRVRGRGDDDAQRRGGATPPATAEAHALTDVTGFGLLGHLHELCEASGVGAEIDAAAVPALPGALELAAAGDASPAAAAATPTTPRGSPTSRPSGARRSAARSSPTR